MDSYIQSILDKIDDFFDNASPEEVEKVKEGFSVKIKGDVSISEYLSGFAESYPYYNDSFEESFDKAYSSSLTVKEPNVYIDSMSFEDSLTNYSGSIDIDDETDILPLESVKKAA